jgi:hypothetical protein
LANLDRIDADESVELDVGVAVEVIVKHQIDRTSVMLARAIRAALASSRWVSFG